MYITTLGTIAALPLDLSNSFNHAYISSYHAPLLDYILFYFYYLTPYIGKNTAFPSCVFTLLLHRTLRF